MSIYDLKGLRESAAAVGFKGTDEELILEYSRRTKTDPLDNARYFGYDLGGKWGNRASASVDSYQANMYGVAEALGAGDWAREGRQRNEAAAGLRRGLAQEQGAVMSYKDIGGVGDFFDYAGGLAVDSAPYLAEAAVGGLAARGLSTGLRAAGAAAREAGMHQVERQIAKQLATRSALGGAAASYPSAVGDILQNQREASPDGSVDVTSALIGGVPYAAANMIGLEGALARGGLQRGVSALDNASLWKRGLGNAGMNALKEGASETAQEVVNQGFGRMAVDPNAGLLDPDALERYAESFVGGATLGGMTGGFRRSEAWHDKQFDQAWKGEVDAADQRVQALQLAETRDTFAGPSGDILALGYTPGAGDWARLTLPDGTVVDGDQARQMRAQGITQESIDAYAQEQDTARREGAIRESYSPTYGMAPPAPRLYTDPVEAGILTPETLDAAAGVRPPLTQSQSAARRMDVQVAYNEPSGVYVSGENSLEQQLTRGEQMEVQAGVAQEIQAKANARHARAVSMLLPEGITGADRHYGLQLISAAKGEPVQVANALHDAIERGEIGETTGRQLVEELRDALHASDANDMSRFKTVAKVVRAAITQAQKDAAKKRLDVTAQQPVVPGTPDLAAGAPAGGGDQPGGSNGAARPVAPVGAQQVAGPAQAAQADGGSDAALAGTEGVGAGGGGALTPVQRLVAAARQDASAPLEVRQSNGKLKTITKGEMADRVVQAMNNPVQRAMLEGALMRATGESLSLDAIALYVERAVPGAKVDKREVDQFLGSLGLNTTTLDQLAASDAYAPVSVEALGEVEDGVLDGYRIADTLSDAAGAAYVDPGKTDKERRLETQANAVLKKNAPTKTERDSAAVDAAIAGPTAGEDPEIVRKRAMAAQYGALQYLLDPANAQMNDAARADWNDAKQESTPAIEDLPVELQAEYLYAYHDQVEQTGNDWAPLEALIQQYEQDFAEAGYAAPAESYLPGADGSAAEGNRRLENAGSPRLAGEVPGDADGAGAVEGEATRPLNREALSGPKFSKSATSGSTVAQIQRAIAKLGIKDTNGRVQVVQSLADLPRDIQRSVTQEMRDRPSTAKVQAFVHNGRAYLIADNLDPRNARAVFLHEVGAHLGLENLLSAREFTRLAKKITQWADANDGSLESRLARTAIERAGAANTPDLDLYSEVIAYFVEEAVKAGVDPTAMSYKSELGRWFASLIRAMKEALRRLNMFNADSLTAQDIVDMAYGAAHLELQEEAADGDAAFSMDSAARTVRDENGNLEYEHDGIQLMFPQEVERFEVIPQAGQRILDYAVMPSGQFDVLGNVQLLVDADGKPLSLLDINMTQRRNGAGEKVVAAILHAHPNLDLNISNIVTGARGFWEKLGVPTQNLEDGAAYDGTLNLQTLQEAQRGRARGATRQGAGRNAGANQGADARAEGRRAGTLEGEVAGIKFSLSAPAPQTETVGAMQKRIDKLPHQVRKPARVIAEALRKWSAGALNRVIFTEDLLNRAKALGMQAAERYRQLAHERAAFTGAYERNVLDIVSEYHDLPEESKGRGAKSVNEFLLKNTMRGTWAYQPDWLDTPVEVDPEQAKFFKALDPKAQEYAKRVHKLGYDSLQAKKALVRDSFAGEYEALIKAAKTPDERAQLEKERDAGLKQFGSLMRLAGNRPYVPLKRFGNTVVIAKSDTYLKAEAEAEESGNYDKVKELERKHEHYFVDFTESIPETMKLKDELAKKFPWVKDREREEAQADIYKNSKTLGALTQLRSRLESSAVENPDAHKAMVKALTELYLLQLAEDSARRSELGRNNVAGNIDVIRSLESQGVADAQFLSGIKYGKPLLDTFGAMRKEYKRMPGDQFAASQVLEEISKRYVQSLNYQRTPVASAMVRATSLWFLATSPSYYIQNATQPWMVSLPYMAGRFDYVASAAALKKAYADLMPGLKGTGATGQMDFNALLDQNSGLDDGERAMLRSLLNSGRIDIGMLTELGDARLDAPGKATAAWNKADRALRGAQLKLEAVNRVSTALAAYRLAMANKPDTKAATAYAEEVIQTTHGDYSAWNAPRAFNTALGKVALQFRKFQLIQLTLLVKMLANSFGGDNSPEAKAARAVARKAFMFTMGQAFLVGGGKGLPIPAIAAYLLAKAFGDEDEPPEYMLRRWIGDKDIADVLINGLPAALAGFNGNALGTFQNTLAALPFTDIDLTKRDSVAEAGFALMSGPFGGLALRAADGLGYMTNGDPLRGLENLLPKVATSLLKAYRLETEGVRQKDGDMTMSPDEITFFDTAQQAIGFTPQRQIDRMTRQDTVRSMTDAVRADEQRIKRDYVDAVNSRDTEAAAEARQAWMELQDRRARQGFERQPMSSLLKAPQEQKKREAQVIGNVHGGKPDARLREMVASQ